MRIKDRVSIEKRSKKINNGEKFGTTFNFLRPLTAIGRNDGLKIGINYSDNITLKINPSQKNTQNIKEIQIKINRRPIENLNDKRPFQIFITL